MMFFRCLLIFSFISISVIWLSEGYFPGFQYEISQSITQKNIKELKFGMSENKILKLLGEPYKKSKGLFYDSDYYLDYSKLAPFNSGIVVRIGIKNHQLNKVWIGDDGLSAYTCDKNRCPYIVNQCFYDRIIPFR